MLIASGKTRIIPRARLLVKAASAVLAEPIDTGIATCLRYYSTSSPPLPARPDWRRFFNPWVELAHVTPAGALGPMVVQFSNSWSLVSVLLCGLSSASLMGTPHVENGNGGSPDGDENPLSYHRDSIFVSWGILNARDLHDTYIVACSTSFFASGCALGLSIVGTCVAM